MKPVSIGLLPLYLKLYDDTSPEHRPGVERFLHNIANALGALDLSVSTAPVCRVADEFRSAVRTFEQAGVDAIVTLHLAYSPSEESAPVLAATELPVIVLDTSPTYDFSPGQSADEIMYNHGIHGVQDLCNLLIRRGKSFQIEAGHWEHSDVLDRVVRWARSAHLVNAMRHARVGRIGNPFQGMGDFAVSEQALKQTLGITVVPVHPSVIGARAAQVSDDDVKLEVNSNKLEFAVDGVTKDAHRRTARLDLAVRHWIAEEHLTAFTVNFMEANRTAGVFTMPFLEASMGMARGIGYAGEGDALTAAFVGALMSGFSEVSFTEMFCADWKNDAIFLSHMGEMNLALTAEKPRLVQRPYSFIDVDDPVLAFGRFKAGEAVFVNLAPGPHDTYTLIVAPVSVLDVQGADGFADSIHGWIKPGIPVANFLARYSQLGGIHHAALVYGDATEVICGFGRMMGWKVEMLS